MRSTGLDIISAVPWGTHFCLFCEDQQDLVEILVPYFAEGLRQNESCLWITSEFFSVEEAHAALAEVLGDLDPYLRTGQLEILDHRQWYAAGGKFEPQRVIQGWADKLDAALRRGFEGLRISGDTAWVGRSTWREFVDYEALVDSVIRRHPMLTMCSYNLAKCGVPEILEVMASHSFALLKQGGAWRSVANVACLSAREALRESEDRLAAAKERARAQLVELLAHEIRNPMAGLRGLAQLVGMKTGDEELRGIARLMLREVDRLSEILDEVLDAFRMQAGSIPLESRMVDLAEIVTSALSLYRSCGTHLYEVTIDGPATVMGDATRLEDMVRNLLGNAEKYSPRGSVIQVQLAVGNGRAVLSVRDHGLGIPANQLDRIFEVFFRASNVAFAQPEGTGLGLYLCKNIVESHGGRIWAESEEGKGSVFRVELPLAAQACEVA